MISADKLFDNFLSDDKIIPSRLAAFGSDVISRLTAGNENNRFATLISQLTPAIENLQGEQGDVDTSLTVQKGQTLTNNQVIQFFKKTMREKEGVIANAVGGFASGAYLEFYPHGLSEYGSATKTQMPLLAGRVFTAAGKYATLLGAELAGVLQGFKQAWQTSRAEQQQTIGSVDDSRATRSNARTAAELALLAAVHTVAALFAGNVEQCKSFFDFALLYPQAGVRKTEKFTGNIDESKSAAALNRLLSNTVQLKLTNTSDNASVLVFLGATADAQPNGAGIEVSPGKSRRLRLSNLGDANNTFLIIKNLSDVNTAAYLLEVKG